MQTTERGDVNTVTCHSEELILSLVTGLDSKGIRSDADGRGVAGLGGISGSLLAHSESCLSVVKEGLEHARINNRLAMGSNTLSVKVGACRISLSLRIVGDGHDVCRDLLALKSLKSGHTVHNGLSGEGVREYGKKRAHLIAADNYIILA